MKQFVLDYLGKACDDAEHIVACQPNLHGADMMIDLDSGRRVAVYVINRALRLPEIQDKFAKNTAKKLHTLFLIDGRMMPDEASEVEPPQWMAALHALGHGRIYAYWADRRDMRDITIRPVHLEWRWGGEPRRVEYGPRVDINALRAETVECASPYLQGHYAMANFGDAGFWKKRDPGEGRQFKYSWRQWTYTGKRASRGEAAQEESSWDPWEAFQQHYGYADVAGSSAGRRYRNYRRQQGQERPGTRRTQVETRDYAVLGLSGPTSFDEVKQAYRRAARENHPDLHPPQDKEKYTARMADINAAFEKIMRQLSQNGSMSPGKRG